MNHVLQQRPGDIPVGFPADAKFPILECQSFSGCGQCVKDLGSRISTKKADACRVFICALCQLLGAYGFNLLRESLVAIVLAKEAIKGARAVKHRKIFVAVFRFWCVAI
jgi:hypothetical protein